MISVDNANAYFSTRTIGEQWNEYTVKQRQTAIDQAVRDLSRAIGRKIREDEPQFRLGDTRRDEYAVYEQAVFSLIRDVMPAGGGSAVPSLNPDEVKEPRTTLSTGCGKWSMEALAWLGTLSVRTVMA